MWSPSVISRPFKKMVSWWNFLLVATVLCQNVWFRGNISENRVVLVQWDRCVRSSGRCPLRLDGLNDFCHHDPRRINNHSSCLSLIIGAAAEIIFHSWLSGELQSPPAGRVQVNCRLRGEVIMNNHVLTIYKTQTPFSDLLEMLCHRDC